MKVKIVTISLVLIFSTVSITIAADQVTTPAQKFNKELLLKNNSGAQSIEPKLVQTSNPHVRPFASIIQAAKWENASVFVCWENPSAEFEKEMAWTKDAVQKTWETYSKVHFLGWQKCAELNHGIRIQIQDSGPHVKTVGRFLDGMSNGMVLNYTFNNWGQSCQQTSEDCIRAIAVHEFGHALGFTHEQNRPDAPGECKPLSQGPDPDTMLTPYDPGSVMNYCNKKWNNDGFLSPLDITAVQILYGKQ